MAALDGGEEEGGVFSPGIAFTGTAGASGTGCSASVPLCPKMTTISRHFFSDGSGGDDAEYAFSIDIIENMQEDYGMFVWPCSIVLAEYIWQQKSRFCGESVIELGAGTSLPGLVAARVGADVVLTDNSNRLEVLDNMRKTCSINNLSCKIQGLTWGEWDAPLFNLKPKIVLGADVFYDTKVVTISLST